MTNSPGAKDKQASVAPHIIRIFPQGLAKLINKIKRGIAELGWINFIFYSADRLLVALSGGRCRIFHYLLVAQPVADEPLLPPHRGANIAVREIHPGDPIIPNTPRTQEMIQDRFQQGSRCFVATRNGEFTGYIWLSYDSHHEDEVRARYRLPGNGKTVWDFDVYVVPAQRLGFTFLRLWDAVYEQLRSQQVQWLISRIGASNLASLSAHKRLGATPIGKATFIVLGPAQIMFSSCPPYAHFSLAQSAPTLLIPTPTHTENRTQQSRGV